MNRRYGCLSRSGCKCVWWQQIPKSDGGRECCGWDSRAPLNPRRARAGAATAGFRWFGHWINGVAARDPGRKIVCIPEAWRFCTEDSLPPDLAMLAQSGRELGIELVLDTQRPETLNPALTGACTELVCFKLASKDALNAVKHLGADRDRVAALPMGSFVSYNILTRAELSGREF